MSDECSNNIYNIIKQISLILERKYRLTNLTKKRLSILFNSYSEDAVIAVAEYVAKQFPKGAKYYDWARRTEIIFEEKFDDFYNNTELGRHKATNQRKKENYKAAQRRNSKQTIGRRLSVDLNQKMQRLGSETR